MKMKRSPYVLIALMLALGLVLAMPAGAAHAEEPDQSAVDAGGVELEAQDGQPGAADAESVELEAQDAALTASEATASNWAELQTLITDAQDGEPTTITLQTTLLADSTDTRIEVPANKNITIDLNGFTLNRGLAGASDASDAGSVIHVASGATLTITDSSEGHNGAITGGYATNGGGIYNEGTLTIANGKVYDNHATNGGGIYNVGTMELSGGMIYINHANQGGGIYAAGNDAVNIYGGVIASNEAAASGGAVMTSTGTTINVKGVPVISGNKAATGNNVLLVSGLHMKVVGQLTQTDSGSGQTSSAYIGVSRMGGEGSLTEGVFTVGLPEKGSIANFFTDSSYAISLDASGEAKVCADGWTALQNTINSAADGATITLDRDWHASSAETRLEIPENKSLTIDLNGHTLDRGLAGASEASDAGSVIHVAEGASLTIVDSGGASAVGKGCITGGYSGQGGGIYNEGTLVFEGGVISDNRAEGNGGGIFTTGSAFIAGGTVQKNTVVAWGGGVAAHGGGSLELSSGTIRGNNAGHGGGIYITDSGSLKISGGLISGNSASQEGGGISSTVTASLLGGTITGNKASVGGGYCSEIGTTGQYAMFIEGSPIVIGNSAGEGGDLVVKQDNGENSPLKVGKLDAARLHVSLQIGFDKIGTGMLADNYSEKNEGVSPDTFFTTDAGLAVYCDEASGAARIAKSGEVEIDLPSFVGENNEINTDYNSLNGANWMSGISGERYLYEIDLPCTHDSGCKNVYSEHIPFAALSYYARTQTSYIDDQLNEGIRKLDIRLNNWGEDSPVTWKASGDNLYLCHGKQVTGIYFCRNRKDELLTFAEVLTWVKDFLTAHPTETVILSFEAELNYDVGPNSEGDEEKVWSLLQKHLRELYETTNESTQRSFLYTESGKGAFDAYTHWPQLKDCRGQVVILSSEDTKDKIGGLVMSDLGVEQHTEGENTCLASTKIERVKDFYKDNENLRIPTTAPEHLNVMYYVGTTTSGPDGFAQAMHNNPLDYADDVHYGCVATTSSFPFVKWYDGLFDDDKGVFGEIGKYYGWVRLDGADPDVNAKIWRANIPSDLVYNTVTVKPGYESVYKLTRSYQLLQGTTITLPECIYDPPEELHIVFGGWQWQSGSESGTMQPGETLTVSSEVEFTPLWVSEYNVTEGDGTVWAKGSGEDASYTFERVVDGAATFDHFTGIQMDGEDVDAKNYTARSGSAIVTLKASYLETLAVGDHTLTAVFDDGSAAASLTVHEHEWGEPTYAWSDDNSTVTATRVCKTDASHVETETAQTTMTVTKEATCEEAGSATYAATFKNAAFETQTKAAEVPALGHDWGEPTYAWSADSTTVTATRVCKRDASHVEIETAQTTSKVTRQPTATAAGEKVITAEFSNAAFQTQTKTVTLPATGPAPSNGQASTAKTSAIPQTGDETQTVAAVALALLSIASLGAAALLHKRSQRG